MEESRSCIVCGCALSEGEQACPVCGTPNAVAASPSGADAPIAGHAPLGPRHAKPRRKRLFVIAGVAVAAIVVVAAILVVRAWLGDRDLRDQAVEAAESSDSAAVVAVAEASGTAGMPAGNAAAGGIAVSNEGVLYEASTDGVFYRDAADAADDTARKLASQGAFDLNVSEGRVFFLAAAPDGRALFEGSSIKSVPCVSGESAGLQSPADEYTPASADARLSCLSIAGGTCYFLERAGDSYALKSLETERAVDPTSLLTVKAEVAWLFVERDTLYLAISDQGAWSVKRAPLDAGSVALSEVAKGAGDLVAAALEGGKFYYAVSSDSGDVHLQRSDLKGGVVEYDDVANPVRIAASGDVVAVMTKAGKLVWVDAVTGVSHDMTDRMDALLANVVPTSAALSVCGEWVCVADGKDGFCRMSVNSAKTVATV